MTPESDATARAELETRLGVAIAADGDIAGAIARFEHAITLARDGRSRTETARLLLDTCAELDVGSVGPSLLPMALRALVHAAGLEHGMPRRITRSGSRVLARRHANTHASFR